MNTEPLSRYTACLLGGAIGDALGAPVEFMSREEIRRRFGPGGIREHARAYGRIGAITDDTQMTLFTAEGLLRAAAAGHPPGHPAYVEATAAAYRRWLLTQDANPAAHAGEQGLLGIAALHSRRAPGTTCLSALSSLPDAGAGHARDQCHRARNNSKGCGGVMRVAPAGLLLARMIADEDRLVREAFALGAQLAALTHGHPSGYLPAGAFAALVAQLVRGVPLAQALECTLPVLAEQAGHAETLAALESARQLAAIDAANHDAMVRLGAGWVGEEALAMSVYCALCAEDFERAVVVAVNHSGDSDSTGAITGNLLGAALGMAAIPPRWLEPLELADLTRAMAADLCR